MGSGQSSQANDAGAFSIDPSGNISPMKTRIPVDATQKKEPANSPQKQLVTRESMLQKELSLEEAEDVVNRMKLKYKPEHVEKSSGQNKRQDIERNLAQCYKANGDQPLNCLGLTKEYIRAVSK